MHKIRRNVPVVRVGRPHRLHMQVGALLVAARLVARAVVFEICSQMSPERQQLKQASAPSSGHQKMAATLWAASPSGF